MTKICPLLNSPCKEEGCMWWMPDNFDCAISDIADSLMWIAKTMK